MSPLPKTSAAPMEATACHLRPAAAQDAFSRRQHAVQMAWDAMQGHIAVLMGDVATMGTLALQITSVPLEEVEAEDLLEVDQIQQLQ